MPAGHLRAACAGAVCCTPFGYPSCTALSLRRAARATCGASSIWSSNMAGATTSWTGNPTTWCQLPAALCRRHRWLERWQSMATTCRHLLYTVALHRYLERRLDRATDYERPHSAARSTSLCAVCAQVGPTDDGRATGVWSTSIARRAPLIDRLLGAVRSTVETVARSAALEQHRRCPIAAAAASADGGRAVDACADLAGAGLSPRTSSRPGRRKQGRLTTKPRSAALQASRFRLSAWRRARAMSACR